MNVRPNVLEKNLKLAEQLAEKNSGKLPNPWSLIQGGYAALYRYILRHPDRFEHLKYDSAVEIKGKTTFNITIRDRHLATAKQLRKELGKLPTTKWLANNGYTKLVAYMRIHPNLFRNGILPQKSIMKYATVHKSKTRRRKRIHR